MPHPAPIDFRRIAGTFVSMDGALVPPRNPLLHLVQPFPFSI
jgi:hypothetical protein